MIILEIILSHRELDVERWSVPQVCMLGIGLLEKVVKRFLEMPFNFSLNFILVGQDIIQKAKGPRMYSQGREDRGQAACLRCSVQLKGS